MFMLFCCMALHAQEQSFNHNHHWNPDNHSFTNHRNPCKVFIGVGTSAVSGGLKVDYTVDDTPASTYGVKAGDIILGLDGVAVSTQSGLVYERNKHQQGEAFTLTILRDGSKIKINARFKECSEEDLEQYEQQKEEQNMRMAEQMEKMKDLKLDNLNLAKTERKERPILGVYEEDGVNVPGMVIRSVISGKGAEAAGLQAGDVVTKVDGKTVTGGGTLRTALIGHQPGDRVTVEYQRNSQTLQTEVTLSVDRSYYSYTTERNPCAVFIGVYTGDHGLDGRGVRVTGIVDETPAKQSGVQPGDIILAVDGQPVNTNSELRFERDKHHPGDPFSLVIVRDGTNLTIDATFKVCPTPETNPTPTKEVVEMISEDKSADQRDDKQSLSLEVLEAYPNPTAGPLNVRFEAEAVPTTVRIQDISGKTVYNNTLNQFNGYFNEQINLSNNKPGTYMLTIQQGKKVSSRKVVLMPRA